MRVLQLVPHLEPVDGVQRAALDLTRGLAGRGHELVVLALAGGRNHDRWAAVATVLPPAPFLDWSPARPGGALASLRAARALPADVDVVIAHRVDLVNAAALIARRTGARLVFHAHNAPPAWLRWRDVLRVPGSRAVAQVVVASEVMAGQWAPIVRPIRTVAVTYPIDTDELQVASPEQRAAARHRLGLSLRARVVGYLGRIEPEKGVHVLAGAVRLLEEEALHVTLAVQGSTNPQVPARQAAAYRARCRAQLGREPHWLRASGDIGDLLAAADVVAVPSVWEEPSGLVVGEALAAGTPVVASAVGGIPAQIPAGSPWALTVAPDDAPALARGLRSALTGAPGVAARQELHEHVASTRSIAAVAGHYERAIAGG